MELRVPYLWPLELSGHPLLHGLDVTPLLYRGGPLLRHCPAAQVHVVHDGQGRCLHDRGSLDRTHPHLIFTHLLRLVHDSRTPGEQQKKRLPTFHFIPSWYKSLDFIFIERSLRGFFPSHLHISDHAKSEILENAFFWKTLSFFSFPAFSPSFLRIVKEWRKTHPNECIFRVNQPYAFISSTLTFWAPVFVMLVIYRRIYKEALRQKEAIRRSSVPSQQHLIVDTDSAKSRFQVETVAFLNAPS